MHTQKHLKRCLMERRKKKEKKRKKKLIKDICTISLTWQNCVYVLSIYKYDVANMYAMYTCMLCILLSLCVNLSLFQELWARSVKLQVFCLRYKLTFYHTQVWVSLPKKSRLRYIIYNRILLAGQRLLRENNNSLNRIFAGRTKTATWE